MPIFDSERFSRDLKIQKANYLDVQAIDHSLIDQHLLELQGVDLKQLSNDTRKKTFWINVYNGLTNTLIIQRKVKKSMMENPMIFFIPKFKIGGHMFSLDDIEHGLLRKNPRAPYKPWKQIWPWDKRLKLMVDKLDYRIHFALNCGANSCPPIAFYSEDKLDAQLDMAEKSFVEQEFIVDEASKTLSVSMIFRSYKADFPGVYLNDPKYKDFKVEGRPYNWHIG